MMALLAAAERRIAVVLGGTAGNLLSQDLEPEQIVVPGYLGQVVEVVPELIGQTVEAVGLLGETAVCFAAVVIVLVV